MSVIASQVALVEPLSAQLGVELGTSLFACKDDVFMGMFTGVRRTDRALQCVMLSHVALLTTKHQRLPLCDNRSARCRGGPGGAPGRFGTALGGLS